MAQCTRPNTSSIGFSEQWLLALAVVVIVCSFIWYVVYDAILVTAVEQFKRLLVISPLLLVAAVHWLSSSGRFAFSVPGSEPAAIHRAGGSPWGVASVLLLLLFLISYQPSFNLLSF